MTKKSDTIDPVVKEPATEAEENALLKARIADLEAKLIDKDTTISNQDAELTKMKEKEEGWLVIANNPLYNGTTLGVLFTDGMAFIPKNRVYPRFVVQMPSESQQRVMKDDKKKYPYGVEELQIIEKSANTPSSERLVRYLVNDFKYQAEFYTKDQMDALQNRINARAKERMEAQAKIDKESTIMEKLIAPQRM
jgi:hypothetical protein